MIVSASVRKQVVKVVEDCINRANEIYPRHSFKYPHIEYRLRGTTAGTANYRTYTVNFNSTLLMENLNEFLTDTIIHEVAHLVDHRVNPHNHESSVRMTSTGRLRRTKRSVHGEDWQQIMRNLGGNPSRTHNMDTTRAKVRTKAKHHYFCETCGAEMSLGPVRHRKMQNGLARYWKRGCDSTHRYTYMGSDKVRVSSPPPSHNRPPQPAPSPAQVEKPKPKPTGGSSKLDICRKVYQPLRSRGMNIEAFIRQAGCTKAGAATYYAKIKKESGK